MHQLSVWNIKTYILPKLKKYNFQRKTLFVENRAPGGYLDRFSNSCVLRWKNRFLQFWENVGFYVTKWFLVHQTTPLDPWLVQVTPRRPCSDIQLSNRRVGPPCGDFGGRGKWSGAQGKIAHLHKYFFRGVLRPGRGLPLLKSLLGGQLGLESRKKYFSIFTPEIPLWEIDVFLCCILR